MPLSLPFGLPKTRSQKNLQKYLAFRLEMSAAIRYNMVVRKQEIRQEAKPNAEVGKMNGLKGRMQMTAQQRQEERIAQWAREVQAAVLSGKWSAHLRELDAALDAHFAQQADWDAEELAEMAG